MSRGVVLLHGFTGSGASWGRDLTRTVQLGDGRVVTPDLPGHGGRGGDRDDACSLDMALEIVREAVQSADGSASRPPILHGYSMGGRIALHFAVRFPRMLGGLVLESASPGLDDPADRQVRTEMDARLAYDLEQDGIEAFVARWTDLPLWSTHRRLSPEAKSALRERRLGADPEGLAAALRGLGTGVLPPLWAALPELDVPVLVLVGSEDQKFVGIGQRMAQLLPNAEERVLERVGHALHLEAPRQWGEAFRSFAEALRT